MTCDLCGKVEASVHLTEIVNDQTRELHLCDACAHEKGTAAAKQFGLAGLLAGLTEPAAVPRRGARENPKCPKCGLTYQDFRKNGRLGCGDCYTAFQKYLAPLLKRVHGSAQYTGSLAPAPAKPAKTKTAARKKAAKPAETLALLKEQLKAAIAAEHFEEAAKLRDKIKARSKSTRGPKERA